MSARTEGIRDAAVDSIIQRFVGMTMEPGPMPVDGGERWHLDGLMSPQQRPKREDWDTTTRATFLVGPRYDQGKYTHTVVITVECKPLQEPAEARQEPPF